MLIGDLKVRGFIGYSVTCRWCSHVSSRPWTGLQDEMQFCEIEQRLRFRCSACRQRAGVIVFPRLARMPHVTMTESERIGAMIWAGLGWRKRRRH